MPSLEHQGKLEGNRAHQVFPDPGEGGWRLGSRALPRGLVAASLVSAA